jgi:hypothetical protein
MNEAGEVQQSHFSYQKAKKEALENKPKKKKKKIFFLPF